MNDMMRTDMADDAVDYDPFAGGAIARVVPTTEAQREIWLAAQLSAEASLSYNESVTLHFDGTLDRDALAQALQALLDRHEALRCTVGPEGTELVVASQASLVPTVVDLGELDAAAQEAALAGRQAEAVQLPFDLANGPLIRALLVRFGDQRHALILTGHHIVCDGWSFGVLARDLMALYKLAAAGRPAALPAPADAFGDHALALLDAEHLRTAEDDTRYWVSLYDKSVPVLELPTDRPRQAQRSFASLREDVTIEPALVDAARKLGAAQGASVFVTLFAMFAGLMSRLSNSDDLVVGVAAAAQAAEGKPTMVGHCVNLLPIRVSADLEQPIGNLLQGVRDRVLDAYEHQSVTFGSLLKKLQIVRDPSRLPLVSVLFNLDSSIGSEELSTPSLKVDLRSNPRRYENFDLYLNASQIDGSIVLECQYKTELFEPATIRRWLGLYRSALARAAADASLLAADAFAAADDDRAQIAAFNRTDRAYETGLRLGDLVCRGVAANPDAAAVVFEGSTVRYRELDRMAWAIAAKLRAVGVGPGQLVGVCLERSVEMVASLVGVVYAGAAYVPLDPTLPLDRLARMREDAGLQLILTRPGERERTAGAFGSGCTLIDVPAPGSDAANGTPADIPGGEADPAYAIFTSGSTGRPKAAMNAHRGIVNRLQWMQEAYRLTPQDRVMQKTPFSFDVSVWEFFWPLSVGATIVVAKPEGHRDGAYLVELARREGVTLMHFVPSMLRFFLDEPGAANCPSLQRVVCSGEALPFDLVQRFFGRLPRVRLANLYGPTEAAVDVTAWECQPDDPSGMVPIGAPIANTTMYVLDGRLRELPIGVPGDLYIGGVQVGMGYVLRPELTAERFIDDPFRPGGRMYKTGDVARWREDGALDYRGRSDHQVKVRGYRIELGEIEATLTAQPGIDAATVITREDVPGDVRIVAYVVSGAAVDPEALRNRLRSTLPDYMIPQHVVPLPAIPLLTSGKVDRHSLPAPSAGQAIAARERVAPRDETERVVLEAMEAVLNLPGMSVLDDFFAFGGHSLLAARLTARLNRDLELNLPLRTLFESPTAEKLARAVDAAKAAGSARRVEIRVDPARRSAPLTPMQERIRFLEELHPGRVLYNTPSGHRLKGPMDVARFEQALREVIARQPALRSCIAPSPDGQGHVQSIAESVPFLLPFEDLSDRPESEREAELMRRMQAVVDTPMNIHVAPLFRAALYKLAEEEHAFLFMPHHIIWDGWSFDLLYEELAASYGAQVAGTPNPRPALPLGYGDYAQWFAQWMQGPEYQAQLAYWKNRFASAPMPLAPRPDRARRASMSGEGATEWVRIDKALTERLREIARSADSTLNMLTMAVYTAMMTSVVSGSSIVIGVPVRGRPMAELEVVMGFFNNLLPVQLRVNRELKVIDFIRDVKRELIEVFSHQDVPFEKLAAEPEIASRAQRVGLYQALFSFQDARERPRQWGGLRQSSILLFQKGATEDLGLWLMEVPSGLEGGITYNADLYLPETAAAFRERYVELLTRLAANPAPTVGALTSAAESPSAQVLKRLASTAAPLHRSPDRRPAQRRRRRAAHAGAGAGGDLGRSARPRPGDARARGQLLRPRRQLAAGDARGRGSRTRARLPHRCAALRVREPGPACPRERRHATGAPDRAGSRGGRGAQGPARPAVRPRQEVRRGAGGRADESRHALPDPATAGGHRRTVGVPLAVLGLPRCAAAGRCPGSHRAGQPGGEPASRLRRRRVPRPERRHAGARRDPAAPCRLPRRLLPQPAPAADGHADGAGGAAARRQRSDGRDRAQPADRPPAPVRRRGDPRHRRLSARQAGLAARPLQRARRQARPAGGGRARPATADRARAGGGGDGAGGRDVDHLPARRRSRHLQHRRRPGTASRRGDRHALPEPDGFAARPCLLGRRSGARAGLSRRTALRGAALVRGGRMAQRPGGAAVGPRPQHRRAGGAFAPAATFRRGRDPFPAGAGQPTRHQPAARADRGGAAACAAAGERRPAHRRHRPRLQQPAHGDPGQPAGPGGPAGRRR